MNVEGFWTALGAISALIAAVSASLAAIFTYRIMQSAQAQVKVSQTQNLQALESERDAQLPVLMPVVSLLSVGYATPDGIGSQAYETVGNYDRNQPIVRVAVKNVGPGIALNIWGIVFEPEPPNETQRVTGQHHSHRYDLPLEPGISKQSDWTSGGVAVRGDTMILDGAKQYALYAPPKPSLADTMRGDAEKLARLTLTYHDIFGRKHAAIYDLTARLEWENVAYVRNIPHDLDEMQRDTLRQFSPLASPWLAPAMNSD